MESRSPVDRRSNDKVKVFFSYSHKDEAMRDELEAHFATLKSLGLIEAWYDRDIESGREFDSEIQEALSQSHLILLLVSPDFLSSTYCMSIEMKAAIERHRAGTARIIPIILRPCDWRDGILNKIVALPKDGKAITTWSNRDEAYLNVSNGVRTVVSTLRSRLL